MTYKSPSMNVTVSAIFCEDVLCKRQMYGTGIARNARSVAILGPEVPIKRNTLEHDSQYLETRCLVRHKLDSSNRPTTAIS